jgi:hypothetical protein
MKKQELVHLHCLLVELRDEYDCRADRPSQCERYDDLTCRPTSVHRRKHEHEEAILVLGIELTAAIEANEGETPGAGRTDRFRR